MDISQSVPRTVKRQKKNLKEKKRSKDSLKVVYISSPMKVKTSASKFMSLVQELTGKNSDIAQYMESEDSKVGQSHEADLNDEVLGTKEETTSDQLLSSVSNSDDTTTTYDSYPLIGRVREGLTSEMDDQFAGILGSNSFSDPSAVDVLGSYDDL